MNILQTLSHEITIKYYYLIFASFTCFIVNIIHTSEYAIFLLLPIHKLDKNANIIFTNVSEAFSAALLLAFYFTLQFTLPYMGYLFFTFIKPALFDYESFSVKRILSFFMCASFIGQYLLFNTMVETFLNFFLKFHFKMDDLSFMNFEAKILPYFSFIFSLCLSFEAFLFFLLCILIQNKTFLKNCWVLQKHLIFLSTTCFLAFVFPPDFFIQAIFTACFLFFLDCFGFFFCVWWVYQEKSS